MRVVSVNVGAKTPIKVGAREAQTGIFKQPVDHPVELKPQGITGDAVIDKKHHGGLDQAVYIYRCEDYDYWAKRLGAEQPPGTFGENLTIAGLPGPGLAIGDRLKFAQVVLEITAPRIPCNVLAARMANTGFVKDFMQVQRPGFYARVIESGLLATGETIEYVPTDEHSVSTVELFNDMTRKLDEATLRRYLRLPVADRVRKDFTEQLQKLERRAES